MRLIAIVGASCSGKTTLARRLVERGCAQVVSTTTRDSRPDERHGRDYWFVDEEAFAVLRARDAFVEAATFGGDAYGVTRAALRTALEQSDVAVAVVTPEGCNALKRWSDDNGVAFRSVFLTAKAKVLRKRLRRERPDGEARQRFLLEQVRQWRTRATYDLVVPGRRAAEAAEAALAPHAA